MSKSLYSSWSHMKQRCLNPRDKDYSYYGGRGIGVCREWLTYKNFAADMGPKPPGTELDRVDNNKGYYPDNCRWASRAEQAGNKNTYRTNGFGVGGVTFCPTTKKFRARVQQGGVRMALYTGLDFFEACCARKSWEAKYV